MTAVTSNVVSCPYCGADVIEGSDNCSNCGQSLWELPLPGWALEVDESHLAVPISAIRTSKPIAVSPTTPARDVIAAIANHPSAAAVVVDGQRVVGIFTDRDVLQKLAATDADLGAPIEQYMTKDPVVLRDDDLTATALHKMGAGGFRHIPLVRDGELASVVTARDIVAWLLGHYFDA